MRKLIFFSTMFLSAFLVACSPISEEDLANLKSPNNFVKKQAIKKISTREGFPLSLFNPLFLNGIPEKRAVDIMVEQLEEGNISEDIQLSLLGALGELAKRTEVPVPPVLEKLKEENSRVRIQAVECLGKIKNSEAVPALIQLLENESNKYPIIWALGEIGDKRAIPGLNRLLASDDKYVRYNATKALAKIR